MQKTGWEIFMQIMQTVWQVFAGMSIWFKNFGYFFAFVAFDYLDIPQKQFTIFGILMVLDVLTGILKARKIGRTTVTSQKLTDGVVKKLLLIILVFTVAMTADGVNLEAKDFLEYALSILIMAEAYSIVQNIYIHRTGKDVPEYDAITYVVRKIGEGLLSILKKLVK